MDRAVLTVFFCLGLSHTVRAHSATQGLAEVLQRLLTGLQGLGPIAGAPEDHFVQTQLFLSDPLPNGRCGSQSDCPGTVVSSGEPEEAQLAGLEQK